MPEPVHVLQVLGRSTGGIARHVALLAYSLDESEGLLVDIAGPDGSPARVSQTRDTVDIPDGIRGHRRAVRALRRAHHPQ